MKVHYPEIEKATPIIGFVDQRHNRFDIAPGETLEGVAEDSAEQMKALFNFLKVSPETPGLKGDSNTSKDVQPTKDGMAEYNALKLEAKQLGVNPNGLKKEALKQAIEDAKAQQDSEKDEEDI